jgi:threonine dehydratase
MPRDAPEIKRLGTERHGAQIRLYDRLKESREEIAASLAAESGAILVPAFDDPHIIAGQGTVGLELMQQAGQMATVPDVIYCPAGGGGLLAGLVTAVKDIAPTTSVVGVEPEAFNDHCLSHQQGERMCIAIDKPTLCDSLMAPAPGSLTWSINGELVDDFVTVTEEQVRHAVSFAAIRLKLTVEPGGAVALAALLNSELRGKTVAIVLSGGNIAPDILTACCTEFPDP